MAKFKFEDYELIEAYNKINFLVDAENLKEAKQKVIDMYQKTQGEIDEDNKDIEIINISISRGNHFQINQQHGNHGFGICCEDNTMTNFNNFE